MKFFCIKDKYSKQYLDSNLYLYGTANPVYFTLKQARLIFKLYKLKNYLKLDYYLHLVIEEYK